MPNQFFIAGPSHEVEGYHFECSFCGFSSRPDCDEHAGDKCAINLYGQTVFGESEEVIKSEDMFEPPEEQFDLPTAREEQGDDFSRQIQTVCCQQEVVIGFPGAKGFLAGYP